MPTLGTTNEPSVHPPALPLRVKVEETDPKGLLAIPGDILDAVAFRPLLEAFRRHIEAATADFDAVFGGRA